MANEPSKPNFSNVQSGSASSAPAPAPKADFSNVQAGSASTAPAAQPEAAAQTYTVVSGDTLSKISKHFYGSANHWNDIFQANRDQLSNPDLIKPGQVLKIPAVKSHK